MIWILQRFSVGGGDVKIAQQAIIDTVRSREWSHSCPRFHADCIMVECRVIDLLQRRSIHEGASDVALRAFSQQRAMFKPDVADMQQPVINQAQLRFSTAALIPPQPEWPQMIICSTSRTSTAY